MNLDLWQFFDSERSHILNIALKITGSEISTKAEAVVFAEKLLKSEK